MLAHGELAILQEIVVDAMDLATAGEVARGYEMLLYAKQQALQGEVDLEPRAQALRGRWQAVLEQYAARYSVGRA